MTPANYRDAARQGKKFMRAILFEQNQIYIHTAFLPVNLNLAKTIFII
jgi:hypothetical protein